MSINQQSKSIVLPSDRDASGRNLGQEEIELLTEVIKSGTLNCTHGTMVKQFEQEFAEVYGAKHCITSTSGTASIHAAIAAINPEPGDEIITTPITDMGGLTPIIYQGAIPIFADVDPFTYNITAETIEPKITKRTKALLPVHLFGNPCDMGPIMELARKHNILVIEDCCQAYFAEYKGQRVGTIGDISCFSLQQGKHMTTGEGGITITNDDYLARQMRLFVNKAWGYGDENPDHYFLAPNYRMTELQGAVALAQLKKVKGVVKSRQETAAMFTEKISDVPGIIPPKITNNSTHVYWKYVPRTDDDLLKCNVIDFAEHLKQFGIYSAPRYIKKPAFMCQVLRERKTFGDSQWPFKGVRKSDEPEIEYNPEDYPGAYDALKQMLVIPWNEFYTEEHVEFIASGIKQTVDYFLNQAKGK